MTNRSPGRETSVRRMVALVLAALAALAALFGGVGAAPWESQGGTASAALAAAGPTVATVAADRRDVSPDLRTLSARPRTPIRSAGVTPRSRPFGRRPVPRGASGAQSARPDPVLQRGLVAAALPGALLSFDGATDADNLVGANNGCGQGSLVAPSDSEGDVGPNHYVEWVNCVLQIFDKNGNTLLGPIDGSTLFAGLGGACEIQNDGDPIVLYDRQADRWLLTQFALPAGGPSHQCIAVSQTPNPTGGYFRYDFVWPGNKVNDYAKFGVWPDGWYMTANQFDQAFTTYLGVGVAAFNRASMLTGGPGTALYVDMGPFAPASFSLLPSHLNGQTPPPAGTPNYLVEVEGPILDPSFPTDRLQVWTFHPDFATPAASTFTGPLVLNVAPFDPLLCGFNPFDQQCVPQPGTGTLVDGLPDRLLFRNNYRNFGSYQALVLNHTVDATGTGVAGVRWYELRIAGGAPAIFQQGTFSPDATYRWMGSINLDASGDIAVGYSASSTSVFPSLRYAARLPTDPPGTLGQGEATLFAGTGSQTAPSRWGDYSTLSIDPSDDCTFWYINQYYATSSDFNWRTRIATFRVPGCVPTAVVTPPTNPGSVGNDGNEDDDYTNGRKRGKTHDQREARRHTNAAGPDDTHISGNVLETHLDEQPPYIILANRDGDVKVILMKDAATLQIQVGQYFSGVGEKQNEQLFWAFDGDVE